MDPNSTFRVDADPDQNFTFIGTDLDPDLAHTVSFKQGSHR